MNFSICQSEGIKFITSDFPVLYETIDTNEGATKLLYIYLPISSSFSLLYSNFEISREYRNRILVMSDSNVKNMNSLYLKQEKEQSKFIIAEDKNELEHCIKESRQEIRRGE